MNRPTTIYLTILFLAISTPAFAYIDPSSGSMIIQVVLAGLLGGLYALKVFWQKIAAFFAKLSGKKNPPYSDAK